MKWLVGLTGVAAIALGLVVKADGLMLQGIERFQSGINSAFSYVNNAWSNAVTWIGNSMSNGWNWLVRALGLGS